jgi:CelD/BcsL family acetyltransferase involved in cellulose biosynthesis
MLHHQSIVRPAELTLDIMVRWRAALALQPNWSSPFLTPEFAQITGRVRKDVRIIVAHDDKGLIGILAIHLRPSGLARPLGAPISDHQAFITEPGFDASLDEVLSAADVRIFSFSSLNDPLQSHQQVVLDTTYSHQIDLAGGSDQYFATQQQHFGKHFKKMRQRTRAALRDHGDMKVVMDSREGSDFSILMQWKRDQYRRTKKCDVLGAKWISALLRALWEENGRVRAVLNVLYLGGKPAAAELGLVCDGVYHSWIAAYDPVLSRCSPGLLLLEGVLRNADALSLSQVDLGAGHDHYKKYYANGRMALGQSRAMGNGFAARQRRFINHYGAGILSGAPVRVVNAMDFMAMCHPGWPGRVRGVAARLAQLAG